MVWGWSTRRLGPPHMDQSVERRWFVSFSVLHVGRQCGQHEVWILVVNPVKTRGWWGVVSLPTPPPGCASAKLVTFDLCSPAVSGARKGYHCVLVHIHSRTPSKTRSVGTPLASPSAAPSDGPMFVFEATSKGTRGSIVNRPGFNGNSLQLARPTRS